MSLRINALFHLDLFKRAMTAVVVMRTIYCDKSESILVLLYGISFALDISFMK